MTHNFIFLGKTKEKYLAEGIEEYFRRLQRYTKCTITYLKESKKNPGKTAEGKQLLGAVPKNAKLVVLDAKGSTKTSTGLAEEVSKWELQGVKTVCYLIGGVEGHAQFVKDKAHLILSLSTLTFTHDMSRLILLEQIYRAYTIKNNEKYHK